MSTRLDRFGFSLLWASFVVGGALLFTAIVIGIGIGVALLAGWSFEVSMFTVLVAIGFGASFWCAWMKTGD